MDARASIPAIEKVSDPETAPHIARAIASFVASSTENDRAKAVKALRQIVETQTRDYLRQMLVEDMIKDGMSRSWRRRVLASKEFQRHIRAKASALVQERLDAISV